MFEAVYEDLELKQRIFRDLDRYCQDDALMVSGTSTLGLSDIASATTSPERVALANCLNPPYLVPLVEVMRNDNTSDETVDTLCALLAEIGKKPVVIQKDVPGFVANRPTGRVAQRGPIPDLDRGSGPDPGSFIISDALPE